MRAGLIPSRALQERRIVQERNEINGVDTDKEGIFKKFNHSQLLKITKKTFTFRLHSCKLDFIL